MLLAFRFRFRFRFRFWILGLTYRRGRSPNRSRTKMETIRFRFRFRFCRAFDSDPDSVFWFSIRIEALLTPIPTPFSGFQFVLRRFWLRSRLRFLVFNSYWGAYDSDPDSVFWFSIRIEALLTPIPTPFSGFQFVLRRLWLRSRLRFLVFTSYWGAFDSDPESSASGKPGIII